MIYQVCFSKKNIYGIVSFSLFCYLFFMEFLDTDGILNCQKNILKNAVEKVYIFSAYLQIDVEMKRLLINKDKNGKEIYPKKMIILVARKDDISDSEFDKLQKIKPNSSNNISYKFNPNLHAKFMMSETEALVSSMNLYEASKENYEAGIHFFKTESESAFEDLCSFRDEILNDSETVEITKSDFHSNYALCDENFLWLKRKSKELKLDSWKDLLNGIVGQARISGKFLKNSFL